MIRFTLHKCHPDFNKWFKGTIKSVWESELFFRHDNSDDIFLDGVRAMKFLKLATSSKWFTEKPSIESPYWKCFPFGIVPYGSGRKTVDADRRCLHYWDGIRCEKREGN